MTQQTNVNDAEDMAQLLMGASASGAAAFARAEHEKAAWALDEERVLFWQDVTALLTDEGLLVAKAA